MEDVATGLKLILPEVTFYSEIITFNMNWEWVVVAAVFRKYYQEEDNFQKQVEKHSIKFDKP